jgi:hypothetical protein
MYGNETWSMIEMDKVMLTAHYSNILRKVYTPVTEKGVWRMRTNQELREL